MTVKEFAASPTGTRFAAKYGWNESDYGRMTAHRKTITDAVAHANRNLRGEAAFQAACAATEPAEMAFYASFGIPANVAAAYLRDLRSPSMYSRPAPHEQLDDLRHCIAMMWAEGAID